MTHKSKANELVETPESARRQRDHAVNLRELDEDAKWLAGALDDLAESVASASVRTLALGQEALALLREAQRPVAPAFVALAKIVTGVSEIIVWAGQRSEMLTATVRFTRLDLQESADNRGEPSVDEIQEIIAKRLRWGAPPMPSPEERARAREETDATFVGHTLVDLTSATFDGHVYPAGTIVGCTWNPHSSRWLAKVTGPTGETETLSIRDRDVRREAKGL